MRTPSKKVVQVKLTDVHAAKFRLHQQPIGYADHRERCSFGLAATVIQWVSHGCSVIVASQYKKGSIIASVHHIFLISGLAFQLNLLVGEPYFTNDAEKGRHKEETFRTL